MKHSTESFDSFEDFNGWERNHTLLGWSVENFAVEVILSPNYKTHQLTQIAWSSPRDQVFVFQSQLRGALVFCEIRNSSDALSNEHYQGENWYAIPKRSTLVFTSWPLAYFEIAACLLSIAVIVEIERFWRTRSQ